MAASCPITPDRVDDRSTRIGAALVILVTLLALGLGRFWIALLLAADFALRSLGLTAFSPISRVASLLRAAFGLAPVLINAGPKRFAALVGTVFALAITFTLGLHQPRLALALGSILALCAALEAFLGFCVGCKVYSLTQRVLGSE